MWAIFHNWKRTVLETTVSVGERGVKVPSLDVRRRDH